MKLSLTILIFSWLVASSALAANSSQLNLRSHVPAVVSVQVNPLAIATTLPLNTSQNKTLVANVIEKWNSLRGTKVTVTSLNNGYLVHQSQSSSKVAYNLFYRGQSVNMTTGRVFNRNRRGVRTATSKVQISYTGISHSQLFEGDYTDVITFSIVAN